VKRVVFVVVSSLLALFWVTAQNAEPREVTVSVAVHDALGSYLADGEGRTFTFSLMT
jgi:hypothetical protein